MKTHELIDKYSYRVEWPEEDGIHIARCFEFTSLMAHGDTIEWMNEEDEKIPEPFGLKKYKGNLTLRVPAEVHKNLVIKSVEEGVSVNQYIPSKIL